MENEMRKRKGAFKKYVRRRGGRGVIQKANQNEQGEGVNFVKCTFSFEKGVPL